jgi:3-oxoacyl-[acyl-carrier-protein] synthase-3
MLMLRSRIVGTGSYLPEKVLTNDDLAKMGVETNDAWIRERTGIGARRVAAPNEATSDMALAASKKALKMAGVRPEQLDMIVVGTVTPDMPFPAAAAILQAKLGAHASACFDVSAACAGSLYAMSIADKFIKTGDVRHALVVGAELLTRIVDWTDRGSCILFGDGAGALVMTAETRDGHGLLSTHLHTDGTKVDILNIPGGGSAKPFSKDVLDKREHLVHMNGREVYKIAVRALEESSREALVANNLKSHDIHHVVAHQANLRILEAVLKRLEIPLERCHLNIEQVGNTSSASVPLTLDQAVRGQKIKDGDNVLMMAIGGGMSWGSALLRW